MFLTLNNRFSIPQLNSTLSWGGVGLIYDWIHHLCKLMGSSGLGRFIFIPDYYEACEGFFVFLCKLCFGWWQNALFLTAFDMFSRPRASSRNTCWPWRQMSSSSITPPWWALFCVCVFVCVCILMPFYTSLILHSKSCLQSVALRSPLMFSFVNYTSVFLDSKSRLLPGALKLSLMFSGVSYCLTWVTVTRSHSCTLQCNIIQPSETLSHWLKALADVSQSSLLPVNHQSVDTQQITPPPPARCFIYVWASLMSNVFGNYSPLSLWQSKPQCSLHCGPRNATEEPEGS